MKVPFLGLKAQYESIKDEIKAAIQEVLDSCAFAGGPFVEKFENEFPKFCQTQYCVGVGSGTEARLGFPSPSPVSTIFPKRNPFATLSAANRRNSSSAYIWTICLSQSQTPTSAWSSTSVRLSQDVGLIAIRKLKPTILLLS